jgi:signal transduction histidine kinase/CTP-dependent riboflavin kinase
LAVQFLGDQLELISRQPGREDFLAKVDWEAARSSGDLVKAGVSISEVDHSTVSYDNFEKGISVKISGLKQMWTTEDLQELAKELWFLKPPNDILDASQADAFDVEVTGLDKQVVKAFKNQMNQALDNWIAVIDGTLTDGKGEGQNQVSVKFRNGDSYKAKYSPINRVLDHVTFKIYVFKLSGKQAGGISVGDARDYFRKFGGIHIYDNTFRLPFYGGDEQDWLQLEMDHSHRLNKSQLLPASLQVSSGLNDLPTNGRIFGLVKISTSHERQTATDKDRSRGQYLNVQVTRDRLIDNASFAELQHSVRWAIDFYAMRSFERRQRAIASSKFEIPKTEEKVSEIRNELFNLSLKIPVSLAPQVASVSARFKELEVLEEQRHSAIKAERILLAALATTGMAALAMEHELNKELSLLQEIRSQLSLDGQVVAMPKLVNSLDNWAIRTTRARKLFSPLMHEHDRERRNPYNAKKVISRVVINSEALLRNVSIENLIASDLQLPTATFAAWNAVFQNVFINAVNAMIDSVDRQILCTSKVENGKACIIVEDTGVGVRLSDSLELFKPFIRRLEIPEERKALGLGGMGIGLTIVKMVADSLDCEVSFTAPSSGFSTAFKLGWTQ